MRYTWRLPAAVEAVVRNDFYLSIAILFVQSAFMPSP